MTMKNKTRRALVLSVLSLILCCSMLVGTTFAWFTDNVTNSVNTIKSGNLDIELYHMNYPTAVSKSNWGLGFGIPQGETGEKVGADTKLFLNKDGKDILWEPGATAVENFRIKNEGTLALKYTFKLDVLNATKTPAGRDLTEILTVEAEKLNYADNGVTTGPREYFVNEKILADGCSFERTLLPGEQHDFYVAVAWKESDMDNEFNVKGGLGLNLGITLQATQYTYEYDGYDGNTYDAGATYDVLATPDSFVKGGEDKDANTQALTDAINAPDGNNDGETAIILGGGAYTMPSSPTTNEVTITGTKDTVLDVTNGAYMDSADGVTIEGVTIKTGTGKVNGNGSDYAALYAKDVTYKNCTFVGPMRVGRDGAKFINCTFTELGNDYVWTYGNDVTFEGCTFNTNGKAILIYNDGGSEVSQVAVKNCNFNATTSAKASAIANQNCAAIEIDNYGNGVNLITSGNTNDSNFSGEWRIKSYKTGGTEISVNGTKYTTIALDGKIMTIDSDKNVTVQ